MCEVECAPVRKVVRQQRPEQAPVRWNAQMQQFVDYHEILEFRFLLYQVRRQRDRAGSRAGTPFPRHTLHSNNPSLGLQVSRPVSNSLMEAEEATSHASISYAGCRVSSDHRSSMRTQPARRNDSASLTGISTVPSGPTFRCSRFIRPMPGGTHSRTRCSRRSCCPRNSSARIR